MTKFWITADEVYPVYDLRADKPVYSGDEVEFTDEEYARWCRVKAEYQEWQDILHHK